MSALRFCELLFFSTNALVFKGLAACQASLVSYIFLSFEHILNIPRYFLCKIFLECLRLSVKCEYPSPKYCQGGSFGRVGYFKAAQAKIASDELFHNLFEKFKHTIPSGIHMKRMKDKSGHETCTRAAKAGMRAIKFHPYYYVLGFTFPMSLFYT